MKERKKESPSAIYFVHGRKAGWVWYGMVWYGMLYGMLYVFWAGASEMRGGEYGGMDGYGWMVYWFCMDGCVGCV